MTDLAFLKRARIEPLDHTHDRAAFTCGDAPLDNFLKNSATKQQQADIARVYISCLDAEFVAIGYYALNSHFIDATTLPEKDRKKLPSYPTMPAIYLSKLGVHTDFQGRGLGQFLMAHAFKRCVDAADIIGAQFLVLDSLNERSTKLYRRLGLVDLPGHEPRMIMKMGLIRKAVALEDATATVPAKAP
jgi:GNAT superfamily N-acetyltransferase